jgi:hypothetical protein
MPIKYESISDIVEEEISKKKYSWTLWNVEWEDVAQILRIRIHKKLHLYNDKKGTIRQWLKVVISSTVKNILRDNYGKYARPCVLGGGGMPCAFNCGGDKCAYTKSGNQCAQCPLYAKWEQKKKAHHDIKQTLSLENHTNEAHSIPDTFVDIVGLKEFVDKNIKKHLTAKEYKFYVLFYKKNKEEVEISSIMGYTSTENRVPGYTHFAAMKRKIVKISKELLKDGGYL